MISLVQHPMVLCSTKWQSMTERFAALRSALGLGSFSSPSHQFITPRTTWTSIPAMSAWFSDTLERKAIHYFFGVCHVEECCPWLSESQSSRLSCFPVLPPLWSADDHQAMKASPKDSHRGCVNRGKAMEEDLHKSGLAASQIYLPWQVTQVFLSLSLNWGNNISDLVEVSWESNVSNTLRIQ